MNFRLDKFNHVTSGLLLLIGAAIFGDGSRCARAEEGTGSPTVEALPSPSVSPARSWTGASGGIFFGYSAVYLPQFAKTDRLNTGNVSTLEGGLELKGHAKIGLRYSTAKVPSLEIYDPTAFITTYYPNAPLNILNFLVGFDLPLNEQYGKFGPLQLFLPINFSTALVSLDAGDSQFKAVSMDGSLGLGGHLYTKSTFRFDVSALYHLGAAPLERRGFNEF